MDCTEILQLLSLVLNKITQAKTIEQEVYAMLVTMFPTIIAPALEIIDHGKITKLICQKSRRHFYLVKDPQQQSSGGQSSGGPSNNTRKPYLEVINDANDAQNTHLIYGDFCFSYFFAKECLSPSENGSAPISKYILAVKLAEALSNTDDISGASPPGVILVKEIDDRDFAPLLLQSRAYLSKYEEAKSPLSGGTKVST